MKNTLILLTGVLALLSSGGGHASAQSEHSWLVDSERDRGTVTRVSGRRGEQVEEIWGLLPLYSLSIAQRNFIPCLVSAGFYKVSPFSRHSWCDERTLDFDRSPLFRVHSLFERRSQTEQREYPMNNDELITRLRICTNDRTGHIEGIAIGFPDGVREVADAHRGCDRWNRWTRCPEGEAAFGVVVHARRTPNNVGPTRHPIIGMQLICGTIV